MVIAAGLPLVPDGALLVANGKQALSLVAQDLRNRGVRTLLAPDYYCLTMIEPFQLEGIRVRHVATDTRALMDAHSLQDALDADAHQAVLHCEAYGAQADAALAEVLASARASVVPVVVDATHSLFALAHDSADYLVASLRKLLPLPDGAFVTGLVGAPTLSRSTVDDEATRLGLVAQQRRIEYLQGLALRDDYVSAVDAAEEAALDARTPADVSDIALQSLRNLSIDDEAHARRANAQYLIEQLVAAGLDVANPLHAECGVLVQLVDADAAEQELLAAGFICPISWPRPPGLARGAAWHTGWITLPVDPLMTFERLDLVATIVVRSR